MSYLLDTVVLSELRKRNRNPGIESWIPTVRHSQLFLSVVTFGEVERGISRQKKENPQFAETLAEWIETILRHYHDRILPVDARISRRWGQLSDQLGHGGVDLLIAATALEHGLIVVTRNVRHFESTGVCVLNPFTPSP